MFAIWQKLRFVSAASALRGVHTASTVSKGGEQQAAPPVDGAQEHAARPVAAQELTAQPFTIIPSPPRYPFLGHSYLFRQLFTL
jgi:hypothetical protein